MVWTIVLYACRCSYVSDILLYSPPAPHPVPSTLGIQHMTPAETAPPTSLSCLCPFPPALTAPSALWPTWPMFRSPPCWLREELSGRGRDQEHAEGKRRHFVLCSSHSTLLGRTGAWNWLPFTASFQLIPCHSDSLGLIIEYPRLAIKNIYSICSQAPQT